MAKKSARKSKYFGLANNLPLLLAILAVVFIVPLVIFAAAGNLYFNSSSVNTSQNAAISRAEVGMVVSQPGVNNTRQYLLKSTLGHSYKLFSTNLNVPSDFSSFLGQYVFAKGHVESVNFYASSLSLALPFRTGFKTEGYVMESGDKNLTKEGVYYFSGTKEDTRGGYFINSYPDRLKALVGQKVKVSGNVWNTSLLNKPLLNALDITPTTGR